MLGKKVDIAKKWRQEVFSDGGYTLRDAGALHALLKGVGYICPHKVCCESLKTRHLHCEKCYELKEMKEYSLSG